MDTPGGSEWARWRSASLTGLNFEKSGVSARASVQRMGPQQREIGREQVLGAICAAQPPRLQSTRVACATH